jgi:hypothetical protein
VYEQTRSPDATARARADESETDGLGGVAPQMVITKAV